MSNASQSPTVPTARRSALVAFALVLPVSLAVIAPRTASAQEGLFSRLDANGDSVLSADEVPDEYRRLFDRLVRNADGNDDGKLSADEFQRGTQDQPAADEPSATDARPGRGRGDAPPRGPANGPPRDPATMFRFLDRDADGQLTPEEVPEERREMFRQQMQRADRNGDGTLSREEFTTSMARMAQRGAAGANPPAAAGPGMPGEPPLLRLLDANRDGELSAAEIDAAPAALMRLDRNGDGKLSRGELGPPNPAMGPPSARPERGAGADAALGLFRQADRDGDGKISRDEAPARIKENFDRIDRNRDGLLDASELDRGMEAMRRRQGGAGQRPDGAPRAKAKRAQAD